MQLMWTATPLGTLHCLSLPRRRVLMVLAFVAAALVLSGVAAGLVCLRVALDVRPELAANMGGMMTAAQVERRDARYRAALAALNREVAAAKDQLGELQRLKDAYARLALPRAHRAPPGSTAAAESASGEGGPALSLTPGASGGAGTRGALSEDLASTGERVGRLTAFLATLREQWNSEFASIDHLPTAPPLPGGYTFTSRFGTRVDPFTGQPGRHEGIDLAAPAGTPIFAAAAGIVVRAGSDPDYGNVVDIDHGNGYVTRYGHARRLYVKVGQRVERGARIAEVGSTGRSTAPHLHFEVRLHHRPENPLLFQHVPG